VPGAFASLLAHERDTLSCRATTAIFDAGDYGRGNKVPVIDSSFGQAWRPAAPADHRVVGHLQLVAEREKR
jgi:hypothetical protein